MSNNAWENFMASMTVSDFKKFVADIPEEFDSYPIWFVDFCMTDSLVLDVSGGEATIKESGNDKFNHQYTLDGKVIKEVPIF